MIEQLRANYIPARLAEVDPDFLEFEEQMIAETDLQRIIDLLASGKKLPNPHNSILLYLTGISDDFDHERERSDTIGGTPPDIDIDFHDRTAAVEWTIKKWGDDNVAKILTHGTYGVRSGTEAFYKATAPDIIWNHDRSVKLNQQQIDEHWQQNRMITSKIPDDVFGKAADMKKLLTESPELEADEALDAWRQYMAYVENKISFYGVHASGVVLSDFPLYEIMPLMAEHSEELLPDGTVRKQVNRVTQLTMAEVEYLGAIKFDFLGIDNLSIVELAIRLIKERHGIDIDMYSIPDHDALTYELMAQGLLCGIFQFETSSSAKRLVMTCKPSSIQELSDLSALNRPGPLAKGPNGEPSIADRYAENKLNGYPPVDMPQVLQDLLAETYWAMIYQEQVMQICSELAGFTLREADDIRRAMG